MNDPFSSAFYEALGREIFVRRKLAGLSSVDLAARVGTSRKTLKLIESGSRTPDLRVGLKAYFALGGSVVGLNDTLIAAKFGLDDATVFLRDHVNRDGDRAQFLKTQLSRRHTGLG